MVIIVSIIDILRPKTVRIIGVPLTSILVQPLILKVYITINKNR
jgi:hypothetical protein